MWKNLFPGRLLILLLCFAPGLESVEDGERSLKVDEWKQLLDSGRMEDRLLAIEELGKTGPAASALVPRLTEMLEKDPEEGVRLRVAAVLGEIGQPEKELALALLEAGRDPIGEVRYNASISLGKLKGDALAVMQSALRDKQGWIRLQAAKGLYAAAPESAEPVTVLRELLEERALELRCEAALLLGKYGSRAEEATPGMVSLLREDNPKARRMAAHALAAIGHAGTDVAEALRDCLSYPDRNVRRDAIMALAAIGDDSPATIEVLGEALGDPEGRVRNQAEVAMAALGEAALPVLETALVSSREDVRASACTALGLMGPVGNPLSPQLLRCLLEDAGVRPRMNAAIALGEGEGASTEVLEALRMARDDSTNHPMVRFHAGRSLVTLTGNAGEAAPQSLFRNATGPVHAGAEAP